MIVLKCYFTNPSFSEVPFWIRVVVIEGLGRLLKIEVKRERRQASKKDEDRKSKRRKSMGDALDPSFNFYHQNHSSRRSSGTNPKPRRAKTEPLDPNFSLHHPNPSSQRNPDASNKSKRPVSLAESVDQKDNLHLSRRRNPETNTESKSPVPMAVSTDPNFSLYHQSHSGRRNTETNVNLLDLPPCGACHELTVDMLHLGPGFPLRNLSRSPSRQSLRRESWCENPCDEKADLNTNAQSQTALITALLHRQEHLVSYVKELARAVEEQDEHDAKREEWILVAEILDTFFLYLFVILMTGSTLLIFTAGTTW